MTAARSAQAVDALREVRTDLVGVSGLLRRTWAMRDNISACDAAYVAAAQSFGCALVTADQPLARASEGRCEVRLVRADRQD